MASDPIYILRGDKLVPQDLPRYYVGVDIGQSVDPTAVSILEPSGRGFDCVHLERLPLGMSYPSQVRNLYELCNRSPLYGASLRLALDATGVGRPIFDMFSRGGIRAEIVGILIHGGNETTWSEGLIRVPKRNLVSLTLAMMQSGRLRIAAELADVEVLRGELQSFEARLSESGHDVYGARSGAHDDLVLALCLSLWIATRPAVPRPKEFSF
jgi:hypothetical protein